MCFVNAMKRYSDGRSPFFRLRRIGKYSTNSGPGRLLPSRYTHTHARARVHTRGIVIGYAFIIDITPPRARKSGRS